MRYQAHRGVATEFPENTMPAFRAAKAQGYDYIECDARSTADNVWCIMHDGFVARTCRTPDGKQVNPNVEVEFATWEELQAFDAGLWMGEQFRGTRIPRLKEVLVFAKEADMVIKLDNMFDYFSRERCAILFQEVAESGAKVAFTCYKTETIQMVTEVFPNAEIHYDGPVSEEEILAVKACLKNNPLTVWIPIDRADLAWVNKPKANAELCAMIKKHARLGIWILNTQEQLEQAKRFGADIIETDGTLKPE